MLQVVDVDKCGGITHTGTHRRQRPAAHPHARAQHRSRKALARRAAAVCRGAVGRLPGDGAVEGAPGALHRQLLHRVRHAGALRPLQAPLPLGECVAAGVTCVSRVSAALHFLA